MFKSTGLPRNSLQPASQQSFMSFLNTHGEQPIIGTPAYFNLIFLINSRPISNSTAVIPLIIKSTFNFNFNLSTSWLEAMTNFAFVMFNHSVKRYVEAKSFSISKIVLSDQFNCSLNSITGTILPIGLLIIAFGFIFLFLILFKIFLYNTQPKNRLLNIKKG